MLIKWSFNQFSSCRGNAGLPPAGLIITIKGQKGLWNLFLIPFKQIGPAPMIQIQSTVKGGNLCFRITKAFGDTGYG
jgi:hypothetical protein